MTREAEQRELRLKNDMEKLRIEKIGNIFSEVI